jgi:hypothetical protein
MASEYLKPMLDVGSPRVLNCNVLTRRIMTRTPGSATFFRNKPMNNLVLIKDTIESGMSVARSSIGTKLYFPFNENDIYEGGRTIFFHDKDMERALIENFGEGAFAKDALTEDMRILTVLDRLPTLDPFLLKDVFRNEGIEINEAYFEVSKEVWDEIELFILQKFEPLVRAAFPDVMAQDEKARKLIETIWEGRDMEILQPLAAALRLPQGEELQTFAAWKGVNFYAFQYERTKPILIELMTWLRDMKIPLAAVSATERNEMKAMLEITKTQLANEWKLAESILREYQDAYDKMFKFKVSSSEFLAFLKRSNKAYWDLGNTLGKAGHSTYCWNVMTKRFPERRLPWEQLLEVMKLLSKIYKPMQKMATGTSW